jgi:hypothetical protein
VCRCALRPLVEFSERPLAFCRAGLPLAAVATMERANQLRAVGRAPEREFDSEECLNNPPKHRLRRRSPRALRHFAKTSGT